MYSLVSIYPDSIVCLLNLIYRVTSEQVNDFSCFAYTRPDIQKFVALWRFVSVTMCDLDGWAQTPSSTNIHCGENIVLIRQDGILMKYDTDHTQFTVPLQSSAATSLWLTPTVHDTADGKQMELGYHSAVGTAWLAIKCTSQQNAANLVKYMHIYE
jgi:hypothetical protein